MGSTGTSFCSSPLPAATAAMAQRCPRCHWRHTVLEQDPGESCDSSEHEEEEFHNPVRSRVLECWHSHIPQIWVDILNTRALCAPEVKVGFAGSGYWLRLPIRENIAFRHPLRPGPREYQVDGRDYPPTTSICAFHHTSIESLVQYNPWAPGSRGILRQGLTLGTRAHNEKRGVNFYSEEGQFGFRTATKGRVALELQVVNSSILSGGSPGRYCITRTTLNEDERQIDRVAGGVACPYAGISALWVRYKDAPDFVKAC